MEKTFPNLPVAVRNWIGRQLFEAVPNNIVVIDRDYRVILANSNFKEVFGKAEGKHCYQAYKNRSAICENCMAAQTFEDGKVRINDEAGFDRNGRPAHYVVHIAPVYDETGRVAYVIEMSYDVTENKSLQKEYNILFERVPCYVAVINRNLQIVRANEKLRDTFGETLGEHCYEVYKNRSEQCPDCPALKTFADGKPYQSEQVGIAKNGEITRYVVSTALVSRSGQDFSHVVEMSADVTALHELSAKLLQESNFSKLLIGNTLDAVVAVDASGRVNIFNRAAETLFQVSAKEVIGKSKGRRFVPREFLDLIQNGGNSLKLEESMVKNAAHEEIPIRFSGSVLRDGDKVIGGAGFIQDLRERKAMEQELLENERLAAVGQTVAQLAHGIKNILTGLQGGMYVIKSGLKAGSQPRIDKGWDMLERNVDRITVLVKGFLSFSKGQVPEVAFTNPNAIAKEVFQLYRDTAKQKGITVRFLPGKALASAYMDAEKIHTCLANLVSNAIDACQTTENQDCSVTLDVKEENDTIIYEVADTGCGMEYEIKNKVFTTFFTTKGLGGTGLGLMVTRKIIQEHGGKITVHSNPGKGSVFRIELPRRRLPQPQTGR